ncbi:pilin [Actinoplanes sp. TFC3]|uniref:pilin n=1 Tax=Actinoplanes sp. TFC3 TaxID=1710355 RepID=UPI00083046D9|nr:pilin [Actinoplanes sp. TFC3]
MNRHPLHRPTPTPRRPVTDRRGRRLTRPVRLVGTATAVTALVVLTCAGTAQAAAEPGTVVLAAASIDQVVNNIRLWLMGILAGWATLCLTVGFLRYTSGEPGEVERGKIAFRSAAIGYAGALLAPLIVTIVGGWVA